MTNNPLTPRPRGLKLSYIISATVLFSVIVTIAINTFVGYRTERATLYNNTLELNRINANELSKMTQTLVSNMKTSLETAAEYFSGYSFDDPEVQMQLDFFKNTSSFFNSITLVNDAAIIAAVSPSTLDLKGQPLSSAASLRSIELKRPFISEPYFGMTGRLIVLVSQPIFDPAGQYKGFISGNIYLQESNVFKKILGEHKVNANGSYFYVVDSLGRLIFHPNEKRLGENVNKNAVVQQLMQGYSGQQKVTNLMGVPFLAGYSYIPDIGWGVVSQTPVKSIDSSTFALFRKMAVSSMPFLLALFGLTFWVSRKLSEPLHRLAHQASRMSRGETVDDAVPASGINHWNYETNELYRTFAIALSFLNEKNEELVLNAGTDALTGLKNRRAMEAILEEWTAGGVPFSLIMIDLDHFKSVNDSYGHQMGDEVLKYLADVMRATIRAHGHCCRYGGEEFAVLLPHVSEEQAYTAAELIRTKMERSNEPLGRPVTLSAGVASSESAQDVEDVFKRADQALYLAKQQGRNRVATADRP